MMTSKSPSYLVRNPYSYCFSVHSRFFHLPLNFLECVLNEFFSIALIHFAKEYTDRVYSKDILQQFLSTYLQACWLFS
jgi:hypothetical protein